MVGLRLGGCKRQKLATLRLSQALLVAGGGRAEETVRRPTSSASARACRSRTARPLRGRQSYCKFAVDDRRETSTADPELPGSSGHHRCTMVSLCPTRRRLTPQSAPRVHTFFFGAVNGHAITAGFAIAFPLKHHPCACHGKLSFGPV